MNEIFGEENYFAIFTRKAMHTVRNSSKDFNKNADFILVYAKYKTWFESNKNNYIREIKDKKDHYPYDDNDGRGVYKLDPLYARNYYTLYKYVFKNGIKWEAPEGSFPRYSEDTLDWMEAENRIVFSGKEPKAKRYLKEVQEGQPPDTILKTEDVGFNFHGTKILAKMLDSDKIFSQPKPVELLKYLISLLRDNNAIILDFFAGSGTTAHAVYELNKEDNGNRKYICVQLAEKTEENSEAYKAGYKTDVFENPVKKEAKNENMLWEILLKSGYDLNTKIDEKKISGCFIYAISDSEMIVCLAEINEDLVKEITKLKPKKCICLDNLFAKNDQLKTNTALQLKDAGVEFKTI